MSNELNELNEKIQRNAVAREKDAQVRREAAKDARIDKAIMACRIPVVLTAATWIAVAMGLASSVLAVAATAPTVCWICYQAGTVK